MNEADFRARIIAALDLDEQGVALMDALCEVDREAREEAAAFEASYRAWALDLHDRWWTIMLAPMAVRLP